MFGFSGILIRGADLSTGRKLRSNAISRFLPDLSTFKTITVPFASPMANMSPVADQSEQSPFVAKRAIDSSFLCSISQIRTVLSKLVVAISCRVG